MKAAPTVHLIIGESVSTLTGGYVYDRHIADGLAAQGWTVKIHEVGAGFPNPTTTELCRTHRLMTQMGANDVCIVDGLVFGTLPDWLSRLETRLIALVHHPLARETGLPPGAVSQHWKTELAALSFAHHIVVTSESTQRDLVAHGINDRKVTVIQPGAATGAAHRKALPPTRLLTVGTITPRKGHRYLLEALASMLDVPWRLVCVGSLERAPEHATSVQATANTFGLTDRVSFAGEVSPEALSAHYQSADVFVLPSLYEGFGIVLLEALAHGLPTVSTSAGGTTQAAPNGSAKFVPPGDPQALASALRAILTDEREYMHWFNAARSVQRSLRGWDDAVEEFQTLLNTINVATTTPRRLRT